MFFNFHLEHVIFGFHFVKGFLKTISLVLIT